jgi:uncharacterized protein involved in exopolysaccharide biosynthesis
VATFDPIEYLNFLARRWKLAAACVGVAVIAAGALALALPKRYTAMATLVIESPAASDPRAGTQVSPIYLESLKSYEEFASSDSLFLKACEKFGLLEGAASIESLKSRVLRVDKLKDTKILQVRVTLPDPKKAQAMAQYVAEETVTLNRSIAMENDTRSLDALRGQVEEARKRLGVARAEHARVVSEAPPALAQEVRSLAELLNGLREQQTAGTAEVAELQAREASLKKFGQADLGNVTERLAGVLARQKDVDLSAAAMEKKLAEKSARLTELEEKRDTAADKVAEEETAYRELQRRATEMSGATGLKSEQLRIIDPGIAPQRPSFPNVPLFVVGALVLSFSMTLAWLSLQYGLARQRERSVRRQIQVARSAGR